MRSYSPMVLPPAKDPLIRRELERTNWWLRQLTPLIARVPQAAQGTPASGGTTSVSLNDYLYLPGKAAGQFAHQRVVFDVKQIAANGTAPVPNQTGIGFSAVSTTGNPITVYLSNEDTQSGRALTPTREWIFPAFNLNSSGATVGYHYFVDANDYQTITKKLLDNGNYYSIEDTVNPSGIFNAAFNKQLMIAWGGTYPAGGFNLGAGTVSTPTGVNPSLQIPSLDFKDNGVGVRDRSHIWCVLKADHANAKPFSLGGLIYGGYAGRELYTMHAETMGTLPAPDAGSLPSFNPLVTRADCVMTISSAVVTMGSTAGLQPGMRIAQNAGAYTLSEDTFVKTVDSGVQITMSQIWPGSSLTTTLNFFGPNWVTRVAVRMWSVVSKVAAYTVLSTDDLILASAAAGAFSVTLPTAVGISGRLFTVKKTDSTANAVTVDTAGGQTIDGSTTQVMTIQYTSLSVVSDGSNWMIV